MKKVIIALLCLITLAVGMILISNNFKIEEQKEVKDVIDVETTTSTVSTTTTSTSTTVTTTKKKTTKKTTKKASATWNPSTASRNEYIEYARQKSGYNDTQMQCLIWLWDHESGWNPRDWNDRSTACGIPQACPCSKTNNAYKTDWKAQIDWGIAYINNKYKNPCAAWNHWKNSRPHSY